MEGLLFPLQGDASEFVCVLIWKLPPQSPELSSAPRAAQSILPSQVNAVSSSIKGKPRGNGDKCGFGCSEQQVPATQLPKQSNSGCCAWRALLEPGVCMGPVSSPDPRKVDLGTACRTFLSQGTLWGQQQWEQQGQTQDPLTRQKRSWENLQLKHGEFWLPVPTELFVSPR